MNTYTMPRQEIVELVYRTSSLLDDENFDAWLQLCDEGFRYRITAYSDELRRPMVWLDKQRNDLLPLFANINRHERYTGHLRRHVSMTRIERASESATSVRSEVAIYHTELNGLTQLYAIGSYHDEIVGRNGGLKLLKREVELHTRRVPFGPHVLL